MAISPNGLLLATASDDHTARLWDARTGASLGEPMQNDFGLFDVAFSQNGAHLATTSGNVQVWTVPRVVLESRQALLAQACTTTLQAGRSRFSEEEVRSEPELDQIFDSDACHAPSFWARLEAALGLANR